MEPSVPVVIVTGTIGVGKTAIAMTMSEILHERGVRHGLLEKTDPLAEQMQRFGIGDFVVDNDDRTPQEVANEVLGCLGWI